MEDRFLIRDYEPSDKNFIFVSWLNGLYYGNDWFQEIPNILFFDKYRKIITQIFERPVIKVKVACLPDDQDVILGFSIYEENTLHWVFVKNSWRKLGIGRALTPKEIRICTHLTKSGRYLRKKYGVIFDPFI